MPETAHPFGEIKSAAKPRPNPSAPSIAHPPHLSPPAKDHYKPTSRRRYEVLSVGQMSAKRGARIYLWEKEKHTTLELELVQSTAA